MERFHDNNLPHPGYKKVEHLGEFNIDQQIAPWLNCNPSINLSLISTNCGKEFVHGSLVGFHSMLSGLADEITTVESAAMNHILHNEMYKLITLSGIPPKLQHGLSTIYYPKPKNGKRVFFTDTSLSISSERIRALLIVAYSRTKNEEEKIEKILTGSDSRSGAK